MKTRNCIRLTSVLALVAIGFFSFGCGEDPPPASAPFTADCSTILVVAGDWNVAFKCENDECVSARDRYEVTQDPSDLNQVSAEIVASDLPSDIGTVFEGQLCGSVFTFSATNQGNDESGSWTFSDTQHFTKETTFGAGTHTCIGTGTKWPLPLPDPVPCFGP